MSRTTAIPSAPRHGQVIRQQLQRDWDAVIAEIAQLGMEDDQNALKMGDLFVEVEEIAGEQNIKTAAKEAGIEVAAAKQRHRVSKQIPPSHRLRTEARYQVLNYTHLRALTGVKDPTEQMNWANQALENQWTASRLRDELAVANVQAAKQKGAPCAFSGCEERLRGDGRVFTLRVDWIKKQHLFCSKPCLLGWLEQLEVSADAKLGSSPSVFDNDEVDPFGAEPTSTNLGSSPADYPFTPA
jgi:hypothetical protein